jgi:hypothetical protein
LVKGLRLRVAGVTGLGRLVHHRAGLRLLGGVLHQPVFIDDAQPANARLAADVADERVKRSRSFFSIASYALE